MDRLHHHDGVIDDDADGQHQAEQGKVVEAETHGRHDGEGADNGHRHRNQGNDGAAPVLQEQEHDDGHQDDGVAQRLEHLVDRFGDERRGVIDDVVIQAGREAPLQLDHLGLDQLGHVQGVGAGELVNGQGHGRPGVHSAGLVVALGGQLDLGDIPELDKTAVAVGFEDHVGKLFGLAEPAHGADGELEGLSGRGRGLADLPGRHLDVLRFNGPGHIGGGQAAIGQLLRVQPHAHAVIALAKVGDVADAGDA